MDKLHDTQRIAVGGRGMSSEVNTRETNESQETSENKISFGEKVKPSFFERLSADNEEKDNAEQDIPNVVKNKQDGCRREKEVEEELKQKYPESEGYQVLRERELCDKDGNPVVDEKTGQKRRIDFVVIKDGKVVDMVEVTSKTADKKDQLAKEYRIRDAGGNYVKDHEGNTCRVPNNVETRVDRRD